MGFKVVRLDAAIVAVGAFNPAIVTPDWLLSYKLISEAERNECMERLQALIAERLMSFDCEWFAFRLIQNQLVLQTSKGATPRLRDLTMGILSILPETPINAVGLNFLVDIQFESANEYHSFGDRLAPKKIWNELLPGLNAGLANLTIAADSVPRTAAHPGEEKVDQKRVTIKPSQLEGMSNTVHMAYNDHRVLGGMGGARQAYDILGTQWDSIREEAEFIFDKLGLET